MGFIALATASHLTFLAGVDSYPRANGALALTNEHLPGVAITLKVEGPMGLNEPIRVLGGVQFGWRIL